MPESNERPSYSTKTPARNRTQVSLVLLWLFFHETLGRIIVVGRHRLTETLNERLQYQEMY